jgi:hypothetical protein
MITRREYLLIPRHLHHNYHLQFANAGIRASVALFFPIEVLANSKDEYFQDIHHTLWHNAANWIQTWIDQDLLKQAGQIRNYPFLVCVCKAVARDLLSRNSK